MTQILTGHGCFYTFLYRIRKASSPVCPFCEGEEDSAEHTVQQCPEWISGREELIAQIGEDLQISAIIKEICDNKESWIAFIAFVESNVTQRRG